jgi:hypothetical protein
MRSDHSTVVEDGSAVRLVLPDLSGRPARAPAKSGQMTAGAMSMADVRPATSRTVFRPENQGGRTKAERKQLIVQRELL